MRAYDAHDNKELLSQPSQQLKVFMTVEVLRIIKE